MTPVIIAKCVPLRSQNDLTNCNKIEYEEYVDTAGMSLPKNPFLRKMEIIFRKHKKISNNATTFCYNSKNVPNLKNY